MDWSNNRRNTVRPLSTFTARLTMYHTTVPGPQRFQCSFGESAMHPCWTMGSHIWNWEGSAQPRDRGHEADWVNISLTSAPSVHVPNKLLVPNSLSQGFFSGELRKNSHVHAISEIKTEGNLGVSIKTLHVYIPGPSILNLRHPPDRNKNMNM